MTLYNQEFLGSIPSLVMFCNKSFIFLQKYYDVPIVPNVLNWTGAGGVEDPGVGSNLTCVVLTRSLVVVSL